MACEENEQSHMLDKVSLTRYCLEIRNHNVDFKSLL